MAETTIVAPTMGGGGKKETIVPPGTNCIPDKKKMFPITRDARKPGERFRR